MFGANGSPRVGGEPFIAAIMWSLIVLRKKKMIRHRSEHAKKMTARGMCVCFATCVVVLIKMDAQ